ncbi:MAG: tripartite tricarboxylate transporter TctB family protein [Proteobacteria bacterium]|nr:tripartite tricarboxylate transporter TctB family protein [Pseudomonadota bacterium]
MKSINPRVGPGLFLGFFVAYGFLAGNIQLDFWSTGEAFSARSFPYVIAFAGALVSLLLLAFPGLPPDALTGKRFLPAGLLLCLMVACSFAIDYLGFAITFAAFLILASLCLGERRPARLAVTSITVVVSLWVIMEQLGIYLRPGALFEGWFS